MDYIKSQNGLLLLQNLDYDIAFHLNAFTLILQLSIIMDGRIWHTGTEKSNIYHSFSLLYTLMPMPIVSSHTN